MFKNRQHAGRLLARRILETLAADQRFLSMDTVVVGLPRGGVPVALEVATALNSPLTVVVSKKIGSPKQPEFAIGAVSSRGLAVINEQLGQPSVELYLYMQEEHKRLTKETYELEQSLLLGAGIADRPGVYGKRVIVVDDGVATGMTTCAALRTVRAEGPAEIILAVPMLAPDARTLLLMECDSIVNVIMPAQFSSVGEFYEDFHQVSDEEVIEALKTSIRHKSSNAASIH